MKETKPSNDTTYWGGVMSGISQTLVGHPFDTWKTRKQIGQSNQYFHKIAYRGVLSPLLFNGMYQSIIFSGTNHLQKNILHSWWSSGLIVGFFGGFCCVPIESYKIKKQCKELSIKSIPWNHVISSTLIRESIGTSIYFGSYYYGKEYTCNNPYYNVLLGGLSGWLSWLITYPIDTIKTNFQMGKYKKYKEFNSFKGFYKGFGAFSIRCFIVNAVGWSVYEFFTEYNK